MLSSLAQRLWQLVLAWSGYKTCPSRRLAETMKSEDLKIKDTGDGSPSIYKLPMKDEYTLRKQLIARQCIGEPVQFQEKVLLVVGAAEAGKGTLINGMVNYIMGVKWEDDFRFKLVIDDSDVSTSNSQTKNINVYTFYPIKGSVLPYKFTIIDTPGFGGTEGFQRDKDITKQIKEFFSIPPPFGVDHLDGIGFVTQSSLPSLTPKQEYIFASILSMFGKDLSKNIFMMVTFAESQEPPVLKALKDAKIINKDRFFKFNNSSLFTENKKDEESFDVMFWKISSRSFADLFDDLSLSESVSLDLTKNVMERRDHLQSLLKDLVEKAIKDSKTFEERQKDEGLYKAQECLGRLDEIALGPDPLLNLDHLELLIESEKQTAKPAWKQRMKFLEEAKRQAEMLFNKKRRLAEIAKCEELKIKDKTDGTPSIYRLPMKEELKLPGSMVAKQSIGEPGEFLEKVLLVVGATGAGKSTLINGMANYIMGVKWEDEFRFKVVIDDAKVSTSKSQTKYITAYTFYPMNRSALSYKFTIIDTPGFGDTEGLKRDKDITKQIKEFFSIAPPNGIDHLDGIGFVTQASLARLTPTQQYIFASVLSIFGKDLSKNIFMMVTFADGQKPPVLKAITDAKITDNEKHFKFNNSALFADNREDGESFDAMYWKMGFRSFATFFADFSKAESVHLDLTKEVLYERDELQTLLEGLNPQINMGLDKIEEMRQEENVLQQREKEIETNKEFTYTVEISKPRQVDISGEGIFTTTCLKCNFTCHQSCSFANDNDKHKCCAMNFSGNCKVCPNHCRWDEHKNLPFIWEYEMVVETRTSEDLKRKYESAKEGKSKVKGMIEKLDEYLQNVHTNVLTMICKAQGCLRRLDEIALKPNPLSNVEYLELLIESEKQTANPGWKQRIHYLEEAKRQAQVLSKVTEVKAVKEQIKKTTTSGAKWYSRFKFW